MNGEMHQICMLVNAAKNAMAGKKGTGGLLRGPAASNRENRLEMMS